MQHNSNRRRSIFMLKHLILALNIATEKLAIVLQQQTPPSVDANALAAQEILLDVKSKCETSMEKANVDFSIFAEYPAKSDAR